MARVALRNIRKLYPGVARPAVDDVSLEIADREFVVLVGPSGCGKSTTLRMIAGLEEASGGDIFIGERRVNDLPPKDRDIAMVFQNYALYPHMTVYRNMAFGLLLRKYPKAEIDRRVRQAAEILGLTEYLDRRPKALSGGQRQRVAVGRAIVRQPRVFLFDEPLSNLDAKMRVQMRAEISRLHRQLEATMVYVTHDQVEAMTLGQRIVVMSGGKVQQVGPPLEIYQRPANRFVAGFIGSPPMNFIEGELLDEAGQLLFQESGGPLRFPVDPAHRAALEQSGARRVTLGLRPEDFRQADSAPADPARWREAAGNVESVEMMGSEVYVYLTTGRHALTARLEAQARVAPGEAARLLFDAARAHYFDAATEACIV